MKLVLSGETFEAEEDRLIPFVEGNWKFSIRASGDVLFSVHIRGIDIQKTVITVGGVTVMTSNHTPSSDLVDLVFDHPYPMFSLQTLAMNIQVIAKEVTQVRSRFGMVENRSTLNRLTYM